MVVLHQPRHAQHLSKLCWHVWRTPRSCTLQQLQIIMSKTIVRSGRRWWISWLKDSTLSIISCFTCGSQKSGTGNMQIRAPFTLFGCLLSLVLGSPTLNHRWPEPIWLSYLDFLVFWLPKTLTCFNYLILSVPERYSRNAWCSLN